MKKIISSRSFLIRIHFMQDGATTKRHGVVTMKKKKIYHYNILLDIYCFERV